MAICRSNTSISSNNRASNVPWCAVNWPAEGRCPLRALALQGPERQGRSHLGSAFTRDKRREHTSARHPKEIGDHAAEFEIGILKELVDPVLALAPCLHPGDPRARHIPQGANLGRWQSWVVYL